MGQRQAQELVLSTARRVQGYMDRSVNYDQELVKRALNPTGYVDGLSPGDLQATVMHLGVTCPCWKIYENVSSVQREALKEMKAQS